MIDLLHNTSKSASTLIFFVFFTFILLLKITQYLLGLHQANLERVLKVLFPQDGIT